MLPLVVQMLLECVDNPVGEGVGMCIGTRIVVGTCGKCVGDNGMGYPI